MIRLRKPCPLLGAYGSTIDKHHSSPPAYESEILSSLSCVRAFETESVWIMCNAGGPKEEGYIGASGVWMPLKGKLAGVKGVEAGFEMVDVDMNVLKVGSLIRIS